MEAPQPPKGGDSDAWVYGKAIFNRREDEGHDNIGLGIHGD